MARRVVAIELYAAMRGLAWRAREEGRPGPVTASVYERLAGICEGSPSEVVERLTRCMDEGVLRDTVRSRCTLQEVPDA